MLSLHHYSCSSPSDILATYRDGTITRGEVTRWLAHRPGTPTTDKNIPKKMNQDLQALCLEKIAHAEAVKSGYDKSDEFLLRSEKATGSVIARVVVERGRKEVNFRAPFVKCHVMGFDVPSHKVEDMRKVALSAAESVASRKKALDDARKAIDLLNKGARFESLAKSVSPGGPGIVHILRGTLPSDAEDAVFSLKKGEYTKTPVVFQGNGSAAVFLALEKGEVGQGNVESVIEPPNEARKVKDYLERRTTGEFLSRLEAAHGGKFFMSQGQRAGSEKFFTAGGKEYVKTDVEKRYALFMKMIHEPQSNLHEVLTNFAREWYFAELYRLEADKRGYLKEKAIAEEIAALKEFVLANDYMRYVGEKDVKVSPGEIAAEYSVNKKQYTMKSSAKGGAPVQLSLTEARPYIEKKIITRHGQTWTAKWRAKTLAESGFKVAE